MCWGRRPYPEVFLKNFKFLVFPVQNIVRLFMDDRFSTRYRTRIVTSVDMQLGNYGVTMSENSWKTLLYGA